MDSSTPLPRTKKMNTQATAKASNSSTNSFWIIWRGSVWSVLSLWASRSIPTCIKPWIARKRRNMTTALFWKFFNPHTCFTSACCARPWCAYRAIPAAHRVLSDTQKRQIYDTYGHEGLAGAGAQPDFNGTIFQDFHDIFGEFFGFEDLFGAGGGRRRGGGRRVQRGADLRYDMTLTFEEAATGITTKIRLPRQEYCESCNGTGAKKGTGVVACQACGGRGQIVYQQGFFTINRTCPSCQGAGQIVKERCPDCRGQGRVDRERTIELRIPPGVDTGTRLRVQGEGEPVPNGGPAGDLYVVLEVKEHAFL